MQEITVEYLPPSQGRYLLSNPNKFLVGLLQARIRVYSDWISRIASYREDMLKIPTTCHEGFNKRSWDSRSMSFVDLASLYGIVRALKPHNYVEIGCGHSTHFAKMAIEAGGFESNILAIEPYPDGKIDSSVYTKLIPSKLEDIDFSLFEELSSGDIVLLDGSHYSFAGTDVAAFWMEVIPRLKRGVVVGIHDILLPFDYIPEWSDRHYNEQYCLAAALLSRSSLVDVILPVSYITLIEKGLLNPLRLISDAVGVPLNGCMFWMEMR